MKLDLLSASCGVTANISTVPAGVNTKATENGDSVPCLANDRGGLDKPKKERYHPSLGEKGFWNKRQSDERIAKTRS